jgi:hypothetical protein
MRSPVPPRVLGLLLAWLMPAVLMPLAGAAGPSSYTGSAPVNTQSDDERSAAMKTALANVVIEQSGDSGVIARADVAKAVEKAERYVLQYSYKRNTSGDAAMTLVVQFDSSAVDQMLQRLGLGALANQPSVPDTPTEANVWVGDIRNADDYTRVIGYLAKSNFVRSAQPMQATADGIVVHLALSTDLTHFLEAVAFERTLANTSTRVDGVDAALALIH